MAFEAVRGYVQLASGLGEMTKAKALEVAQGLLTLPGAEEVGKRALQASALADQLLEAARANRQHLVALVRGEVEAAMGRADFARHADLETARATVAALAREVDELRASVLAGAARSPLGKAIPGVASAAVSTGPRPAPVPWPHDGSSVLPEQPTSKRTAQKATAKKATAKKSTAKKSTATTTTAEKATKKAATKKAATKKAATKKAATKKAAKTAAARKAATTETATASGATSTSAPTASSAADNGATSTSAPTASSAADNGTASSGTADGTSSSSTATNAHGAGAGTTSPTTPRTDPA